MTARCQCGLCRLSRSSQHVCAPGFKPRTLLSSPLPAATPLTGPTQRRAGQHAALGIYRPTLQGNLIIGVIRERTSGEVMCASGARCATLNAPENALPVW